MKIYLVIAIGSLLTSCATVKEPVRPTHKAIETTAQTLEKEFEPVQNIKIKAQIGELKNGDPIQIEGVRCEGNTLFLSVSYGGGCGEHSFQFNASTMVLKSWPPKRTVKLIHTNHEDYCKAILIKTIEVNLVELANIKKKGSTTILLLNGWDKPIEYTFE
jgi:hypothetical protein